MNRILSFLLSALLFLTVSCNNPANRAKQEKIEEKRPVVKIPGFNMDSAYQFVSQQVKFGPRVPNTPAHERCAAFLEAKMKSYCPTVTVQQGKVKTFDGTVLNFKNIIASYNPDSNNRIFICSHWDSRPWADYDPDPKKRQQPVEAANDGASGVGILIEIARQLSLSNPNIGVDLILFDAEDYGPPEEKKVEGSQEEWWGLASQYWARQQHKENYYARYGILLDMVGASGATFTMEGVSMQYAPDIVTKVWKIANRIGYSNYFLFEKGNYITDDHYYINSIRGIPTIDIIHLDKNSKSGFYSTWHTTGDVLSTIDKNTLKAVGQTLLTVIYEER